MGILKEFLKDVEAGNLCEAKEKLKHALKNKHKRRYGDDDEDYMDGKKSKGRPNKSKKKTFWKDNEDDDDDNDEGPGHNESKETHSEPDEDDLGK